jgi:GAF domain-containing protein
MYITESQRLDALKSFHVLDTPAEPQFNALVFKAARYFNAPIAAISLVDLNRQWFKAVVGLNATETPRAVSFCTHAISSQRVFVVEDAIENQTFSSHPAVVGDPGVRFYAGAPLRVPGGACIGTICVVDVKPRPTPDEDAVAFLEGLARNVVALLELRRDVAQHARLNRQPVQAAISEAG